MTGSPGQITNLIAQSANQQVLISWDLAAGATSYIIQKSLDNVTYTTLATLSGSPLATSYVDTAVTPGTQYWYTVSAANGVGIGIATLPQQVFVAAYGEMTLGQIRLSAQQRADRVGSNFVTTPEWNGYIRQALYELYDLLITTYEDYYLGKPIQFVSDGVTWQYPLPNGSISFTDGITPTQTFIAPPFYKLMGVDLALNNATNSYVTVNKFNFIDRNRFVYPNTASTIYGVFNLQYRVMGSNIQFIPTPSAGQALRLWYIPRLKELLADTDTSDISVSGWIEYVIVRAAKYALDKEESDTTKLDAELQFLKDRIESSASNRDAGQSDTISDTRSGNGNGWGNGFGGGWNGGMAGW